MVRKKYLKQIKSFERLISEHNGKIEKEKVKDNPNTKLIKYWKKEIEIFKNELFKSEKRLKRR